MGAARSVPGDAPVSDADPFSIGFFEDPHSVHEGLREAGPVVWLSRYGIRAVARHAEVHAVLNDWRTFCSARGVGMDDYATGEPWRPRSLVLETDPPEHDRARAVLRAPNETGSGAFRAAWRALSFPTTSGRRSRRCCRPRGPGRRAAGHPCRTGRR